VNPLEARRRLLGRNVYKRTTEGNPAIAQGSLARMYPGIVMQGWTEQAKTTGANLIDISKAVNRDLNRDSITLFDNGFSFTYDKSNANTRFVDIPCDLKSGESYICTANRSSYYISMYFPENSKYVSFGSEFSPDQDMSKISYYVNIDAPEGTYTVENLMLNEGTTALPYEPYTGGKPSPSPEYPQEIVSAGTQNQETGKWEYEITIANAQTDPDKNQTVTLTSDRPLTKWDKLEKRNGQWGWVYKSEEIETYTDESVPGEYFSTTGQLSTGAQVWYETSEETFVPLSAEEQEAMNALHTYRPTTVLSNDAGCEMSLTYKTKKSMGGGGVIS